jgi:hypothetical protein
MTMFRGADAEAQARGAPERKLDSEHRRVSAAGQIPR